MAVSSRSQARNGTTASSERHAAPAKPQNGPIMSAAEVGALLRLKPETIHAMARRRELPSLKIGRYRRYLRADIVRWIEGQRRHSI